MLLNLVAWCGGGSVGQGATVGRGGQRWAGTSGNQLGAEAQFPLSAGTSGPGESKETTHTFLFARKSCGLTFSKPGSEVRVVLSEEKKEAVAMLMSDGPWSPEHIYQEIVGYGKTWHRGGIFNWAVKYHQNGAYHFVSNLATF